MIEEKVSMEDLEFLSFHHGEFRCGNQNHPEVQEGGYTSWCGHIKRYISSCEDAEMITADSRVIVPIFPSVDLFAPVHIHAPEFGPSARMEMEYQPDIGRSFKVPLGIWNPGEGMASLRGVILDYLKSKIDPDEKLSADGTTAIKTRCPNRAHSLRSARILEEGGDGSLHWRWECLWNIVMEGACTPCILESGGDDDSNFGIDPSVIPGRRRSTEAPF